VLGEQHVVNQLPVLPHERAMDAPNSNAGTPPGEYERLGLIGCRLFIALTAQPTPERR
jgi:hypothetical protein